MRIRAFGVGVWLTVGSGLGVMSCGGLPQGAEGAGGGASESIAVDEQALTQCTCDISNITETAVGIPLQTAQGPSTFTNICWLSAIDGYTSSTTSLNARVYQQNGYWRMTAANGTMSCVPTCCFHSNSSLDTRMLSGEFVAVAVSNVGENTKTVTTNMWQSDAMPILSGLVYGRSGTAMFNLGNEGADVLAASQPLQPAVLKATARSGGATGIKAYTYSYGYSFFMGIPYDGQHPAHIVKKKDYGFMSESSKTLISTRSGICTLGDVTRVTSTNGYAYVHADGDVWKAGRLSADVRPVCYYYAQDQ